MPLVVANPNPDRARRARAAAANSGADRSLAEHSDEDDDDDDLDGEGEHDDQGGGDGDNNAEDGSEAQVVQPTRQTGLNCLIPHVSHVNALKRRRSTTHPIWTLVQKFAGQKLKCMLCAATFSGGATRATEHLLGPTHLTVNLDPLSEYGRAYAKVKSRAVDHVARKERKKVVAEVNQVATSGTTAASTAALDAHQQTVDSPAPRRSPRLSAAVTGDVDEAHTMKPTGMKLSCQRTLASCLNVNAADEVDKAIGRCFFACNIPAAVVEHPKFKEMVNVLKCAPTSYKTPTRQNMLGPILDGVVYDLRVEEHPLREIVVKRGGTAITDGWDTAERNHLINMLVGTHQGMFFDGTYELSSDDHENAPTIAKLLGEFIVRTGRFAVVQLCTDTCSVMKSAWQLVCQKFPWITATCCGTHVLNLELKDIAKIPEIAAVIEKVRYGIAHSHYATSSQLLPHVRCVYCLT